MMSNRRQTNGPVPLVIGVTGHRDLRNEDLPGLKVAVQSCIESIQRAYPYSPIVVMSPLAEGADRLVARVGLELGAKLVVPMPFAQALYEKDFLSESSLLEFRELLSRAINVFELPIISRNTVAEVARPGPQRDAQYAEVGLYVARHSQIVIALWNGRSSDLTGGGAQIVDYRLHGGAASVFSSDRGLLEPEELGVVVHIVTPRISDPVVEGGSPLSSRYLYPGDAKDDLQSIRIVYEAIWHRIGLFNEKVARRKGDGNTNGFSGLWSVFQMADQLSLKHQRLYRKGIWVILWTTLIGACILEFADSYVGLFWHGTEWGWMAISACLFLMMMAVLVWGWCFRWRDVQSHYLDYRAFAEGLRVQHYWVMAGISKSVADHYLGQQIGELAWIRHALRSCSIVEPRGEREVSTDTNCLVQLKKVNYQWVKDQAAYYGRQVPLREARQRLFRGIGKLLATVGVVLIMVLLGIDLFAPVELHMKTVHYLFTLCGLSAATITAYLEVMAFEEESRQYRRMSYIFRRSAMLIDASLAKNDIVLARRLLTAVGAEALAENGNWVLTHRARPLEMPEIG